MSDDLKTRLRWAADSSDGCGEWNCDPADLYAAADRIEELEAKLAKVKASYRRNMMQAYPAYTSEQFDKDYEEMMGETT